jgi:hypothetical protein
MSCGNVGATVAFAFCASSWLIGTRIAFRSSLVSGARYAPLLGCRSWLAPGLLDRGIDVSQDAVHDLIDIDGAAVMGTKVTTPCLLHR